MTTFNDDRHFQKQQLNSNYNFSEAIHLFYNFDY
jgi:hypothetical protein